MERIRHLVKRKLTRLIERGVPCTDKECEDLLVPDDAFARVINGKWRKQNGGPVRKRARHKAAMADEESAAKRLEKAIQQRGGL